MRPFVKVFRHLFYHRFSYNILPLCLYETEKACMFHMNLQSFTTHKKDFIVFLLVISLRVYPCYQTLWHCHHVTRQTAESIWENSLCLL